MPSYLTGTLKSGQVLTTEFRTEEDARAELRSINRMYEYRLGLPEIYWRDVTTGQHWCLSIYDFEQRPHLLVPQTVAA